MPQSMRRESPEGKNIVLDPQESRVRLTDMNTETFCYLLEQAVTASKSSRHERLKALNAIMLKARVNSCSWMWTKLNDAYEAL